jgi:uncharacterized damage-inducible protein DinB
MLTRLDLTKRVLDAAFIILSDNLKGLKLEEALFVPKGGFRSIIGTLKHTAGWSHVYRSYAFDQSPISWSTLKWPHGLRDTIIKNEFYLAELIQWLNSSHKLWQQNLSHVKDNELDQLRPVHWGETMPLFEIVRLIANHHIYHAGEINQLLSIYRSEAWEEGEEVEENNIASDGHRVVPPWKR